MALSAEAAFACGGLLPASAELPLLDAILHPASSHTSTFEIFRPHGAAQDAAGCSAASLGAGRLAWAASRHGRVGPGRLKLPPEGE